MIEFPSNYRRTKRKYFVIRVLKDIPSLGCIYLPKSDLFLVGLKELQNVNKPLSLIDQLEPGSIDNDV